jgi:hypothetical protein
MKWVSTKQHNNTYHYIYISNKEQHNIVRN